MRFQSTRLLGCLGLLCLTLETALADGGGKTAKLLPNDGALDDRFGESIAISGTTAIVGALGNDDTGANSGSAYLFDTLTGVQIAKLLPSDAAAGDTFGNSVAISGTTAIVGAQGDSENGSRSGSAYLFDTQTGVQIAKLLPSDGATLDLFGFAVAISGTTAIVGAPLDNDNGSQSGSVYLFDTLTGVQIAKLLPNDGAARDQFGISIGISGSTAIVGAGGDDDNGSASGSAYLFDIQTGVQTAKILANDGAAGDGFGRSVAISGTTVIVGAANDGDNGDDSGSAYLFDTLTGAQIAKLLPSDGAAGDIFGLATAISGTTAIVSAQRDDDNGIDSGSAYLFDTLTGMQLAKLLPSDGAMFDRSGDSVAISGSTAIMGSSGDDDNGTSSGSVYLFDGITIQAAVSVRNGSGLNASILSLVSDPVLGSNFITDLDCSGHSPSTATLVFQAGASSGVFLPGGELLVDMASPFLFSRTQVHTGGVNQFSVAIPNDPALCGLTSAVQAVVFGAPFYELSNALDIVIGL